MLIEFKTKNNLTLNAGTKSTFCNWEWLHKMTAMPDYIFFRVIVGEIYNPAYITRVAVQIPPPCFLLSIVSRQGYA